MSVTESSSSPRLNLAHKLEWPSSRPSLAQVSTQDVPTLTGGISGEKLPPPPSAFEISFRQMPHAPRRPVTLTPSLIERALTNALRYFPPRFHEELIVDFLEELRRFGHIYAHRFMPRNSETGEYAMAAQPIHRYQARSTQAAALMHMIQNNLDPQVAQFPAELVTYGGNGSAFSNWAQYHETMRLLAEMEDDQTLVLYSGKFTPAPLTRRVLTFHHLPRPPHGTFPFAQGCTSPRGNQWHGRTELLVPRPLRGDVSHRSL